MIQIHWGSPSGPFVEMIMDSGLTAEQLKLNISQEFFVEPKSFYLTHHGRILNDVSMLPDDSSIPVIAVPRLLGGKGGFGSMLRAIGAQIEKTTNRDACRDLSGRRLRDINEEQRLKRWFAKQKERDEEKAANKKIRLEKLRKFCEGPALPIMEDREYNQQRADMSESVFEAVDYGFEASSSSKSFKPAAVASSSAAASSSTATSSSSNSSDETEEKSTDDLEKTETEEELPEKSEVKQLVVAKKEPAIKEPAKLKKTMWDEDLDSDVSSSESEDEIPQKKAKIV